MFLVDRCRRWILNTVAIVLEFVVVERSGMHLFYYVVSLFFSRDFFCRLGKIFKKHFGVSAELFIALFRNRFDSRQQDLSGPGSCRTRTV